MGILALVRENRMLEVILSQMSECPLWVISGHWGRSASCPLYPQKRTFVVVSAMSALCQKQTLSPPLFDHIVGKLLELCGHLETQGVSGLQIDDQLEFGRLLDR